MFLLKAASLVSVCKASITDYKTYPDVNTDDGHVSYEKCPGLNFRDHNKAQSDFYVQSKGSWLAVVTTSNFCVVLL